MILISCYSCYICLWFVMVVLCSFRMKNVFKITFMLYLQNPANT